MHDRRTSDMTGKSRNLDAAVQIGQIYLKKMLILKQKYSKPDVVCWGTNPGTKYLIVTNSGRIFSGKQLQLLLEDETN